MKKQILTFLATLLLFSCSKDDATTTDNTPKLPPETQTGANTFGVTINGKVFIPRDPTGTLTGPSGHGMKYKIDSTLPWSEIYVIDGKSAVGFQMIIHFKELLPNSIGIYHLKASNFHDGLDSSLIDHIYFKIWDANISNYAYYGSIENQGEIKITRFNGSLTVNWILSGNFKGKFVRYDNPNDFITITDGRFDLNLNTLPNATFP
jgi:hypothetical protein